MLGRKVIFDDTNLHELGVVESVTKENLSIELVDYVRAEKPNVYKKFKRTSKEVTVRIRLIKGYIDYPRLELEMDKVIIKLHTTGLKMLNVNGLYAECVLANANHKVYANTGELNLTFINYDGLFYGQEKTVNIGQGINLDLATGDERLFIKLRPNNVSGKVTLGEEYIEFRNVLRDREIIIDFNKKTIKQLGENVEITLSSTFFNLKKGQNTITGSNVTGTIHYREVVAL